MFPVNFFYGTLIGLQRQVLSNAIIVGATAFRGALTVVALFGFGSSPVIFFSAQMVASAIEIAVLGSVIWAIVAIVAATAALRHRAAQDHLEVHLGNLARRDCSRRSRRWATRSSSLPCSRSMCSASTASPSR